MQIRALRQPHNGAGLSDFESMRNGTQWAFPETAIAVVMRLSKNLPEDGLCLKPRTTISALPYPAR
jgi:hypothetical protein